MVRLCGVLLCSCFMLSGCEGDAKANSGEVLEYELHLKNNTFDVSELKVPSGKRLRITVFNHDKTAEEFDSVSLNREKIIPGEGRGVIILNPLQPGEYDFSGEFHPATAHGKLIVE